MAQYAIISTEKGDMKAELYTDETPGTVANFVKLAESRFLRRTDFPPGDSGIRHSGRLPAKATARAVPGYTIKCETSAPRQYHDRGVLSMAHAGTRHGRLAVLHLLTPAKRRSISTAVTPASAASSKGWTSSTTSVPAT